MSGKRAVFEKVAQAGFIAKGIVYGLIGLIAGRAVLLGGSSAGEAGLVHRIATEPYGKWLLGALALGLFAHAAWWIIGAIADPEGQGEGRFGWVIRVGLFFGSFGYLGLGYLAGRVAVGAGSGGDSKKAMTAELLSHPMGKWAVGLVALVVLGVAIGQLWYAYTVPFMKEYSSEMSAAQRGWAKRLGRFGSAARGVTLMIIAWFFARAAWYSNAKEAAGLDRALAKVSAQPYGKVLLGIVAAGFVAYAIHCFATARFRRFVQR